MNKIPKIIWTFWDSPQIPTIITYCINTWRKHNPKHKINIINLENIKEYLPEFEIAGLKHTDSKARISDFVRLNILAKYGGIWIDASIICNRSLTWVHKTPYEFIGFYLEMFTSIPHYPVLESWFFACVPNCKFTILWRDTFMLMNDFKTTQDYVNYLINSGTNIQKIDNTDYLAIHVAAQYVIQVLHYPLSNFLLLKAEDGPFQYLVNRDWNIELATDDIMSNKITTDLIKLRGCDRVQLEHKNWEPNS